MRGNHHILTLLNWILGCLHLSLRFGPYTKYVTTSDGRSNADEQEKQNEYVVVRTWKCFSDDDVS